MHARPHSTVLLLAQVTTGAVVSTTVTVWRHMAVLPQQSVACQVRVMSCLQGPRVVVAVSRTVIVTFVPQRA